MLEAKKAVTESANKIETDHGSNGFADCNRAHNTVMSSAACSTLLTQYASLIGVPTFSRFTLSRQSCDLSSALVPVTHNCYSRRSMVLRPFTDHIREDRSKARYRTLEGS